MLPLKLTLEANGRKRLPCIDGRSGLMLKSSFFKRILWTGVIGVLGFVAFPASASAGSTHVGQPLNGWGSRASHVKFYEKMITQYNQNPDRFSQRHRLMTRSIRTPKFFEHMTMRLLTNPARFIKYHPCFSKFLDGQLATLQTLKPAESSSNTLPGTTAPQQITGGGSSSGGGTSPSNPVVPEPSSLVLVGSALIAGGLIRRRKRCRQVMPLVTPVA